MKLNDTYLAAERAALNSRLMGSQETRLAGLKAPAHVGGG